MGMAKCYSKFTCFFNKMSNICEAFNNQCHLNDKILHSHRPFFMKSGLNW